MVRTVIVDVPDKTYARLEKLSRFFDQDVGKSVLDLLESQIDGSKALENNTSRLPCFESLLDKFDHVCGDAH